MKAIISMILGIKIACPINEIRKDIDKKTIRFRSTEACHPAIEFTDFSIVGSLRSFYSFI